MQVNPLHYSDGLTLTQTWHWAPEADDFPLLFALGSLASPCVLRDLPQSESPQPLPDAGTQEGQGPQKRVDPEPALWASGVSGPTLEVVEAALYPRHLHS